MTLGSLFDGIGTWQLAAVRAGIQPLWSSEIDSFCQSVTRRHFPDTVQLGDINLLADAPEVDIITASSPCQDLSVAGRRGGLTCERSGLFFKAVELVRRINPKFFIWENVPGAFSSNGGNDFRAVIEEILQEPVPLPKHWSNAGLVDGRNCQIAWRLLDAQFFGVPQRRERIFLVADFTARRAAEILFEQSRLSGNSPTCEVERQTVTARTRKNSDFAVYDNHWKDCRIKRLGDVAPTVSAMYGTGGNNIPLVAYNGVRRLTPKECERLMGLPDDWTAGGSDTRRYKALGNGVALPCVQFILNRIKEGFIMKHNIRQHVINQLFGLPAVKIKQVTGELGSRILDKHGKEIFENDIISNGRDEAPVKFINGSFAAVFPKETIALYQHFADGFEIIGHAED